jgi:hypothetical protein
VRARAVAVAALAGAAAMRAAPGWADVPEASPVAPAASPVAPAASPVAPDASPVAPAASPVAPAAASPATDDTSWLDHLTITQSLDPKLVAKPALFQYVHKKAAADVYIVNLGARYDLLGALASGATSYLELGPSLDIQENTAADKAQKALKAGVSLDAQTGSLTRAPVLAAISASLNYVRDDVKHTSGAQAKAYVTLVARGCGKAAACVYRPNVFTDLTLFDLTYGPYVGVELDDTLRAATAAEEGAVARVVARLFVALYVLPAVFQHRVELLGDFTIRDDVLGGLKDGAHPLAKLSANLYVYKDSSKKRAAGIGLDFTKGEDPDAKFQDQTLAQISLKVMF